MKLRKQYPFLEKVMNLGFQYPFERNHEPQVGALTIKVARADGDLMYRIPRNVGIYGDRSALGVVSGPHRGGMAKQGEHLYAISHSGEVINSLPFGMSDDVRRQMTIYGRDILYRDNHEEIKSGGIHSKIAYLTWVTVEAIYKEGGEEDGLFGEFVERSVEITIYLPPKEGFRELEQKSHIEDHLWLNNRTLTEATLRGNSQVIELGAELAALALKFNKTVYSQGMKQKLEEAGWKGHSASFDEVEVKAVWGFQRVGVEISNSKAYVEFHIRDDGDDIMYAGAFQGVFSDISELVATAIKAWRDEENRLAFQPDEDVINFMQALNKARKD